MTKKRFSYLLDSLVGLWNVLKTRKAIIAILFILQLLSITLFSYILVTASITVAEDLQSLTEPLANLDLEDPSITEQEILTEGAKMFAAYEKLSGHVWEYALQAMLIFFTIPGLIWAISLYARKKTKSKSLITTLKTIFGYYFGYLRTTVMTVLPYFLIVALTGKLMLESDITAFSNAMQILTGVGILIIIVTLAALSHSNKSLKVQFHSTKLQITKKPFSFLLALILAAIPIAASTYLLYVTTLIQENFTWMLIAMLLTVLSIILARIYIIIISEKLIYQINHTKKNE